MIQKPRGTQDYLGDEFKFRRDLENKFVEFFIAKGFEGLETPLMEQKTLFVRSVGEETDIISKELFDLEKKSDEIYSLRPEFTAGTIRALIEKGLKSMPKPVKILSVGPCFRYERPQKGRKRQFNQLNLEVIGKKSPEIEIEFIKNAIEFLKFINISDVTVSVNSLGSSATRKAYSEILNKYLVSNAGSLCDLCNIRMTKNPLRVLDCKNPECQQITKSAPSIISTLPDDEKSYYDQVVSELNKAFESNSSVSINEDASLVRGLDYYTGVIFEFNIGSDEARISSIGGGGRYDDLIKELDGPDMPAIGMGFGFERLVDYLKPTNDNS
jgi:histidyl-tRNA synthetase